MLLISEAVLSTAVRALPGYSVAGHAPEVFQHAVLTNAESASAPPAERRFLTAAITGFFLTL